MKRALRILMTILCLALLLAGAWRLRSFLTQPPKVEVAAVEEEDIERILALTGRVRPQQRNLLVPAVRARLLSLTRQEGEAVRVGEVLARLDDRQVEADRAQARAALLRAEDEVEQLHRNLDRATALTQSGLLPLSDLEAVQLDLARSRRRVEEGRQVLAEVEARRDDYVLRSPLDGHVLERPVDAGQVVGPEDVIYELATAEDPEVEMEVDERYLAEVFLGQGALVAGPGSQREPFTAEVSYIGRRIDRLSGAAIVRLRFKGDAPDLPVGLSLDVNLAVQTHHQALTVPRAAVAGLGGQTWVMVVEGGRTARREVEVVDWPASRLVVLSGIMAGELVVLEPRRSPANAEVRTVLPAEP